MAAVGGEQDGSHGGGNKMATVAINPMGGNKMAMGAEQNGGHGGLGAEPRWQP